jgi:hypothetical protein
MHCTFWSRLTYACTLDRDELKLEEPTEQVQAEDFTNLVLDQGKPGASHQLSLVFFNHYNYVMLECALSYRNCVGTVVALWLSFQIILNYLLLVVVSR